jgi:hypothetical protein
MISAEVVVNKDRQLRRTGGLHCLIAVRLYLARPILMKCPPGAKQCLT